MGSNFACMLFGSEQAVYSLFYRDFSLKTFACAAKNNITRAARVNLKSEVEAGHLNNKLKLSYKGFQAERSCRFE